MLDAEVEKIINVSQFAAGDVLQVVRKKNTLLKKFLPRMWINSSFQFAKSVFRTSTGRNKFPFSLNVCFTLTVLKLKFAVILELFKIQYK